MAEKGIGALQGKMREYRELIRDPGAVETVLDEALGEGGPERRAQQAPLGHLGDAALAAVGLGSFVLFTCQAMILGLSVGVQAIAARRRGEGRLRTRARRVRACSSGMWNSVR